MELPAYSPSNREEENLLEPEVEGLLSKLTVQEKVDLLSGKTMWEVRLP